MRKLGRGRLPARYSYTESLQPDDWAWEFLRRNPEYREDAAVDPAVEEAPPDPTDWGCDFVADPERRADEIAVFWLPELLGNLIPLAPGPPGTGPPITYEPWRWPGRKQALSTGDRLQLIVDGEQPHRLLLPGPDPPDDGAALGLVLDRSRFWRARLDAAARFLAAVGQHLPGFRPPPPPHLSDERRDRLTAMLWALDLQRAGASEHEIAGMALGTSVTGPAWSNHPDRGEVRRLLAEAGSLVAGGYRRLLAPPWR